MNGADRRAMVVPLVVWLVLVLLTLVSWQIGHGDALLAPATASALILTAALVKARLIILHFMEVRFAPLALRLVFEAWCVGVWGGLLVLLRG